MTPPHIHPLVAASLAAFLAVPGRAQTPVPYPRTPTWESDRSGVTTGGAFADLDRDGWPDLVVANGNDILRQRIAVYYNKGDGTFPVNPDWQSKDVDYHGHLDVGDVDGDGWPDVVVAVFLGPRRFSDPGTAKLYLNDGKGRLGVLPAWVSTDRFYSFSVALGDVDGDGDLDLAVATGEPYRAPPDVDRVFLNQGGTFSSKPDWKSTLKTQAMDVGFRDVDGDGDLDLAFACVRGPDLVYYNRGGTLPQTPGWTSTDGGTRRNCNSLVFGDVDGDGRPDLVISDNRQLGGRGTFRVYRNLGTSFTRTPWWESASFHNGYTSGVALLDFDLDGDLDLAGGGWWTQTAFFRNQNGKLPATPSWETTGSSVVEAVFFADVDRDGLRPVRGEAKTVRPGRKLYSFGKGPVQSVAAVRADGVVLTPDKYALHLGGGWVSLKTAPARSLTLDYTYSEAVDLGVTNWDRSKGNYLFRRRPLVEVALAPPAATLFHPGAVVAWTETITSTAMNPQYLGYRSFLDLPHKLGTLPFLSGVVTLPAGFRARLPLALPLPPLLPPELLGRFAYRVELAGPDPRRVMSRGGFAFVVEPDPR